MTGKDLDSLPQLDGLPGERQPVLCAVLDSMVFIGSSRILSLFADDHFAGSVIPCEHIVDDQLPLFPGGRWC